MLETLLNSIRERQTILFVGAGVSMGLGLPSWGQLIDHMGEELGYDPGLFGTSEAGYMALAEYYKINRGTIGALRSWMDRTWNVDKETLARSEVHRLIVELDFPMIYTTNYDRNIENAFDIHKRSYVKVANARDVANVRDGRTQIVKFHGDFDDDSSLVLTETDYFDRLQFESPLDLKFRADTLGKSVLFIGYSLTDINIRLLLHRLWRIWRNSGYEKERPSLFVFMTRPDHIQEEVLAQWGITSFNEDADSQDLALSQFLGRIKRQLDGKPA